MYGEYTIRRIYDIGEDTGNMAMFELERYGECKHGPCARMTRMPFDCVTHLAAGVCDKSAGALAEAYSKAANATLGPRQANMRNTCEYPPLAKKRLKPKRSSILEHCLRFGVAHAEASKRVSGTLPKLPVLPRRALPRLLAVSEACP